jgi:hypothetical protein
MAKVTTAELFARFDPPGTWEVPMRSKAITTTWLPEDSAQDRLGRAAHEMYRRTPFRGHLNGPVSSPHGMHKISG